MYFIAAAAMAQEQSSLMTLETLIKTFREALAILAQHVNPAAYRNHVLALFLLKRINDQVAEHSRMLEQAALQAGRSPEEARARAIDPDEHRWVLPPLAHWENIKATPSNLGAALETACAELERHNPKLLAAVLSPLRFETAGAPAVVEQHEAMLRALLGHFDQLALGEQSTAATKRVGQAAEFLLAELAHGEMKKGGSTISANALMQLLAELLEPAPNQRVCDPACGAGGALLACAEYLQQRGHSPQTLSLFGQEFDAEAWALCKMNLLLHDLLDARIVLGSTLTQPLLDEAGRLLQFDLVLAEPPFSLGEWEHEAAARSSLGRFDAGLPPARRGEFAFVQHIVATLNANGRAAIVVPHGVLFRGGVEKQIRAALLQPETDLVEAVIALPAGVLGHHKAHSAILILNRNKPEPRRGRVLFLNAAALAHAPRAFQLDKATRLQITTLYHSYEANAELRHTHLVRAVSLAEIATTYEYSLHVARYVAATPNDWALDVAQTLTELDTLDQEKRAAEEEMARLLKTLGYN